MQLKTQRGAAASARQVLEYKWVVLITTTIGVAMASLDNSILTISLPDIMHSVNASVVEVMWMVMGYSLIITALLLPFGRLADMKGRVRLFNAGFVLFTVASALCGLSQTGSQLVLFRLLQGIGSAFLFSNSVALLTDAFPANERGMALGVNMMCATSGFIMGMVFGGVITQFLGWRYIFFVNVPIGIFAAGWCFLKLRESSDPDREARFDIGGIVSFPLAVACILAALTFVTLGQWGSNTTDLLFAAGAALLVLFFMIERRVREPMMDLTLFRIRLFWAGNSALFLNALSRGATMFIMSWYFQAVLQDEPVIAGLKVLPLALIMGLAAPVAGRLADRLGSRLLATMGLMGTCVAMLWMSTFEVHVAYPVLAAALVILGASNAFFNTPNTSAVMSAVPAGRRGVAAGTRTLLLNSGQTMAIALTMAIVSTTMSYQTLVDLFSGSAAAAQNLDGQAFMDGLHKLFLVSFGLSAIGVVCSALRGKEHPLDVEDLTLLEHEAAVA
ncbi:MAG: MFS transporter [Chloroflexi bacterium]|nr:MFS transporter [Chloroflexota bacterium]